MSPDYGDGGSLAYCTCRWNHDNGGSDSVMNAQELSNVLGGSVFKLCPPKKIEIKIDGDLGLPSGTIWMTKNVGANSETEAGKYFAWGMKEGFYANQIGDGMFTLKWYNQQEIVDWTNFRFEDGSHAPSKEQINELRKNCTYEFMKYKGVDGGMFTSKINGNSIFLPAAGLCYAEPPKYVGWEGLFWSCSWKEEVYFLYLFLDISETDVYSTHRCHGLPVRGVV